MKLALSGAMFGDDILKHIEVAGKIGYLGVEIRGMGPLIDGLPDNIFLDKIENKLRHYNLAVSCLSTWLGGFALRDSEIERNKELDRCISFFKLARRLNCPFIRVNPARVPPLEATEDIWKLDSSWIIKAADLATEFNITILLELHHGTICDTPDNALKLWNMVNKKNVGFVYDPYNLIQIPCEYGIDTINKLGSKIFNVHCKDIIPLKGESYPYAFEFEDFIPHAGRFIPVKPQQSARERRYFANRLINQGALDWHHIIESLKEIGYDLYLTVEATSGKDPEMLKGSELAAHCYDQLARILRIFSS